MKPRIRPVDTQRWRPYHFINDSGYPVTNMDSLQANVVSYVTALIIYSMRY